jgi:hypothetical protein
VYPVRLERSAKLRVAVEFLVQWFKAPGPTSRKATARSLAR